MSADRCKETVYPNDRYGSFHGYRCTRKAVCDGYCKTHAKIDKTKGVQKYIIKYDKIEKVLVNQETDKFMWVNGWKQQKVPLFDSFQSAKDALIGMLLEKMNHIHRDYLDAQEYYEKAKTITEVISK